MNKTTPHPSERDLQLYADGELSSRAREQLEEHLSSCWPCRTRLREIEEVIADVVTARRLAADAKLGPFRSSRAELASRLHAFAAQTKPNVGRRLSARLRRLGHFLRPKWIPVTTAFVCFTLLVTQLLSPVRVSAELLMIRAERAQTISPVAYQKVRIRFHDQEVVRHVIRKRASTTGRQQPGPELASLFARGGLDWNDPLDARTFAQWHDHLLLYKDKVEASHGTTTLTTEAMGDNPVDRAVFTVRGEDYWPVRKLIRFRQGQQVEISELESQNDVPPTILAAAEAVQPNAGIRITAATPSRISPSEFADTEVAVRSALHQIGADLGEEVSISPGGSGGLVVRALVGGQDRKREILEAISPLRHVHAEVSTFDEVQASSAQPDTSRHIPPQGSAPVPLLDEELRKAFPGPDARAAFVNDAIVTSQKALDHAWALRRLAERYDPHETTLLSPKARQTVESLVREHAADLSRYAAELATKVEPIIAMDSRAAAKPSSLGWRMDAQGATVAMLHAHEILLQLLSGASEPGAQAEPFRSNLQQQLQKLKETLDALRAQIAGPFLNRS